MPNKAALLSVLEKLSPKSIAGMMTVNKTFKEVGTVALRKHKEAYIQKRLKILKLKRDTRVFANKIKANDVYRKSAGARMRKLALVSRAHDLGIYKKTRPNPRGGFLGTNSKAPAYLTRNFVRRLSTITPSGYFKKYPRSPIKKT
jgi:hypothetical protein